MNLLKLGSYGTAVPPRPDPNALTVGQVHLGLGAFHRAHQAIYTEDAMRHTGETHWAIAAFTQRSGAAATRLRPQDGLYTVTERGAAASPPRVVGALREVGDGSADPTAMIERICDPAVHVVTLTVTEKGYCLDPATGGLDFDHPRIADDLHSGAPRTVPGVLAHAIARRARSGAGPLTVISCDNLPHNGRLLQQIVHEFSDAAGLSVDDGATVTYPSTVVDRIVPATTDEDIAALSRSIGVRDQAPVMCEPFRQWVIESRFAGPVPAWSAVGTQLVDDVAPWEQLKLRVLNAAHSTLAYLGLRLGYRSIAEAVHDSVLADICRRLFADDVRPSLDAPAGLEVGDYGESVLARFANTALPHTTLQVASDGSQKIGPRLLRTVSARAGQGTPARWAALGIAGWALHVVDPVDADGQPTALADPRADELTAMTAGLPVGAAVRRLVTEPSVVGSEAAQRAEFVDLVVDIAEDLHRYGADTLRAQVP
ncbi:mannitol dehydrogenase family protein [Mycolicibacterium smegmatis]|uniref:Putative oxidoreductase YeiQ n=1 Tax=Mycolicibacterium smegmatis (strain MKD8) TaxID=1214915 RepID=A0A2U9PPY1_MYCSE|nr:mannitol dehydrogenase family protein [Mycolicibacterium smegmatis]AWT53830.1 putative oxidoreductase YeiQ [Mycolicibacterium smegmatis MKD8]